MIINVNNSYNRRKYVVLGCILSIFITILFFIILMNVYAANPAISIGPMYDFLLQPFNAETPVKMFHLDDTLTMGMAQGKLFVLSTQSSRPGISFTELVKIIGMFLMAAAIFYHFFKQVSEGTATKEMFLTCLARLVIGLLLIGNLDYIIYQIYYYGNKFLGLLTNKIFFPQGENALTVMIKDDLSNVSYFGLFDKNATAFSKGVSIRVFSFIIGLWLNLKVYTLMIELLLRRLLMPLPLYTIMLDGARSAGVSFMKKLIGVYLKMFIMFYALQLGKFVLYYMESGSGGIDFLTHSSIFIFTACTYLADKGNKIPDDLLGTT